MRQSQAKWLRLRGAVEEMPPIFIEPVSGKCEVFPEVKVKGAIKGEEFQITKKALDEAIRRGYKPDVMIATKDPTFTAGIGDISWSGTHSSFLTTTKEGLIERIFNIVEPKVVDVTGRTAFIEKLKRLSGEDLARIVEEVSKSDFGAKK